MSVESEFRSINFHIKCNLLCVSKLLGNHYEFLNVFIIILINMSIFIAFNI